MSSLVSYKEGSLGSSLTSYQEGSLSNLGSLTSFREGSLGSSLTSYNSGSLGACPCSVSGLGEGETATSSPLSNPKVLYGGLAAAVFAYYFLVMRKGGKKRK